MRLGKVDFPEPVVAAARSRELVVFAGAGVSMGKPAGLPGFRQLAEEIAGPEEKSELDIKRALDRNGPDVYLGRLKNRGVVVHARASEILSEQATDFSELHRVLLGFYPRPDLVRVVTTNFDLLFEQAAKDVFSEFAPETPKVYCFPEFPVKSNFRGIVHLHGDVEHFSDMVLTDEDFGAAYLGREPRAQRFVINLLSTNTLLFVGYSGDDVIFRYLTRGLSSAEGPRHFAMVRVEDEQQWLERGIQPVSYPTSLGDPDGALCESLSRFAKVVDEGPGEQQSRIKELARHVPSGLNREQIDLVADALSDAVRRKFFTRAATSPKWIVWLDDRKYLDALFGDKALKESDHELAKWLTGNFVHDGAEKLFVLIGKHGIRLHVDFWRRLLWQVALSEKSPTDCSCTERWVSLLLSTAPPHIDHVSAFDFLLLGERCIECGLTNSAVEIFKALTASCLIPEESLSRRLAAGELALGIDAELGPAAEPRKLIELWRKGLQPQLPQIANRLFPILAENLAKQHRTLRMWGQASKDWDPTSFNRSAIEPHDQDCHPGVSDVVIDATRDCLQWLAEHERDAALRWCERLAEEQAPILRRLAVHALTKLPDVPNFGPDEKINWLLSRGFVDDINVHHEIFQAMRFAYPRASRQRRQAVIDAVPAFRQPSERDPDGKLAAYARFNWFHWLHSKAPDCDLAENARDKVLDEHPEFRPRPYPDLKGWRITDGIAQSVELRSPWSADQLLAEPAERWVSRLIEYRPERFPLKGFPWARKDILDRVAEAAKKDFNWGVDLADALARDAAWEVDLWGALLQAWANADEGKIPERHVLRHLSQGKLHSEHSAAIADLLYAWARSSRHAKLLDGADRIATALWFVLSRDPEKHLPYPEPSPDWLTSAINCPSGVLTEFWLVRISAGGLSGECRTALSAIARDSGVAGRLGRTVLARSFPALLHKDEEWARENLLPFFEWAEDKDVRDCQAAWEGFLYRPYLGERVFPLMRNAFHAAIEQLQDGCHFLEGELRKQFLIVCAEVAANKLFVPDPLKKWLPHVLRNCRVQDKAIFVTAIGELLELMSVDDREESWHRWLKEYWRLRRHGAIAGSLTREETTGMFYWLPHLRGVTFTEAVDLAVQTGPMPDLQHDFLFRELDEAGLCEEQPEAMVKLLRYLDKADLPEYAWQAGGGKLIRKLQALEIPDTLNEGLADLVARYRIPDAEGSVA